MSDEYFILFDREVLKGGHKSLEDVKVELNKLLDSSELDEECFYDVLILKKVSVDITINKSVDLRLI